MAKIVVSIKQETYARNRMSINLDFAVKLNNINFTSDNRYSSCFGLPFWLHFLPLRSFSFSNIRIKILVNHLSNSHKLLTQPKLKTICHNITLLYSHYGTLIQVSRTTLGLQVGKQKRLHFHGRKHNLYLPNQ